ncbi:hypothetical protein VTH06DRAFT_4422 [Thermothelomyces fergusii]
MPSLNKRPPSDTTRSWAETQPLGLPSHSSYCRCVEPRVPGPYHAKRRRGKDADGLNPRSAKKPSWLCRGANLSNTARLDKEDERRENRAYGQTQLIQSRLRRRCGWVAPDLICAFRNGSANLTG